MPFDPVCTCRIPHHPHERCQCVLHCNRPEPRTDPTAPLLRETHGAEKADTEREAGVTADRVYVASWSAEGQPMSDTLLPETERLIDDMTKWVPRHWADPARLAERIRRVITLERAAAERSREPQSRSQDVTEPTAPLTDASMVVFSEMRERYAWWSHDEAQRVLALFRAIEAAVRAEADVLRAAIPADPSTYTATHVGPDGDDVYDWVCFACREFVHSGHIEHAPDCAWLAATTPRP